MHETELKWMVSDISQLLLWFDWYLLKKRPTRTHGIECAKVIVSLERAKKNLQLMYSKSHEGL